MFFKSKTPAVELTPHSGFWDAFNGASRFRDGTPPLFAEIEVPDLPIHDLEEDNDTVVLVLDEQEPDPGRFETVLTVNGCDAFGLPFAYTKSLPADYVTKRTLRVWAEKNLRLTMSHRELLLAGFVFESFGAKVVKA